MTNWQEVKLDDICKINTETYSLDENLKYVNYLDTGNITSNRIENIQYIDLYVDKLPSRARRKVKNGNIIYSTVRPNQLHYGLIKEQPDNFLVSTGFAVLDIDTTKAIPEYVYYSLTQTIHTEALQAIAEQSTSAYPSIKSSDIGNRIIPLPPLDIQKKIAGVLGVLDDKIELNNKINNNLEQQAQALFKSWFVDFEPFGGKMPDDWKIGTFSELIVDAIGGDWGKDVLLNDYTEEVYCIRGADIPEVKVGNKGKMPKRYILPKNYLSKKLKSGDLVVEISGGSPTQSTGRIAAISDYLLSRYDEKIICTNFCKAIQPKANYSEFIYYYWQYLYDKNIFFSYENGTTGIKNFDISGFIETEKINIPDQKVLNIFSEICKSFFKQIYTNGQENEQLSALRDTLLPKLMSGEIDVDKVNIKELKI